MPIQDLIHKEIHTCSPTTTIKEAVAIMRKNDIGSVVVIKNQKPIGILTDRDIVLRCVINDIDCSKAKVEDAMTRAIETIPLGSGVQETIDRMRMKKVRRMPVVDKKGRAIGILSMEDLLQMLSKELSNLSEAALAFEHSSPTID